MGRCWRVLLDPAVVLPGAVVELPDAEARHVQRVLRLRSGDAIGVFDGVGGEWRATLLECTPRRVAVKIGAPEPGRVEAPVRVALFQGRCEPARMEWLLQKATELGVASFHPVAWEGPPRPLTPARLQRWRRIVAEACKQSGRRRIPSVEPVERLPAAPSGGPQAWLLDPAGAAAARRLSGPAPPEVLVAVGPASGLQGDEVARHVQGGWLPTALGPRTLRAETAGLVAASLVLHCWGDLGSTGAASV